MGEKVDHKKLVMNMIDSIALLGHASHELIMLRRWRLQPALKQEYTALCSMDIALSEYLFGDPGSEMTWQRAGAKRVAKSAKLLRQHMVKNFRDKTIHDHGLIQQNHTGFIGVIF